MLNHNLLFSSLIWSLLYLTTAHSSCIELRNFDSFNYYLSMDGGKKREKKVIQRTLIVVLFRFNLNRHFLLDVFARHGPDPYEVLLAAFDLKDVELILTHLQCYEFFQSKFH